MLVARAWDPMPDSLYGAYFVDRPPPLIALFKAVRRARRRAALRILGAVVAGAGACCWPPPVARLVADEHAGPLDGRAGGRAAAPTC